MQGRQELLQEAGNDKVKHIPSARTKQVFSIMTETLEVIFCSCADKGKKVAGITRWESGVSSHIALQESKISVTTLGNLVSSQQLAFSFNSILGD